MTGFVSKQKETLEGSVLWLIWPAWAAASSQRAGSGAAGGRNKGPGVYYFCPCAWPQGRVPSWLVVRPGLVDQRG